MTRAAPTAADSGRRLLFVITSLAYGGAESLVVELARRFQWLGWKVGVVSMVKPQAYEEELRADGVEVFSLEMRRGLPDPRGLLALASIYRRFGPDVVHAHMVHANLLARLARLLTPLQALICTAHNTREGGPLLDVGYRFTDPMAEFTTNVSPAGVTRYREVRAIREGKSGYVPNGISLQRFSRDPSARQRLRAELGAGDGFIWLTVGRITEQKDYPNLFRALAAAPSPSLLWLVGEGELREECEAMVADLGLGSRVRFLGVRKDVHELMSAADGFVLGSAWEGLPMVLLEAAASGLPMVATDVGGVSEVVRPGTGLLVPSADSVALGAAMQEIEKRPREVRTEMGRVAREGVLTTFDIEVVTRKWEGLFVHAMRAASGKRVRLAHRLNRDRVAEILDKPVEVTAGM